MVLGVEVLRNQGMLTAVRNLAIWQYGRASQRLGMNDQREVRSLSIGIALFVLAASGCGAPTQTLATETPQPAPAGTTTPLSPSLQPTDIAPTSTAIPVTPAPLPTAASIDVSRLRPGESVVITSIAMITDEVGWGTSDGHVLYTEDGGNSWREITPPEPLLLEPDSEEQAVGAFLDEEHAWIAFSKPNPPPQFVRVWVTQDAGSSWSTGRPLSIAGGEFFDIKLRMLDPLTGWALTDSVVMGTGRNDTYQLFATEDGGATWTETILRREYVVTDLEFGDQSTGWMTEEQTGPFAEPVEPFLKVTADGGADWERLELPSPKNDPGLFERYDFCSTYETMLHSADSGSLVVECFHRESGNSDFRSYLYSTSNGGKTWQTAILPLSIRAGSTLHFFDDSNGLMLGEEMYRTTNGGQSWANFKEVSWQGQFSFVNEDLGWAVARAGDEIALVKTEDGASIWEVLNPIVLAPELSSLETASTPVPEGAVPTPMGGGSGQVAFISGRGIREAFTTDIYLINVDGPGLTKLTDGSGHVGSFSWSPDGERIAFASNRDGDDMEIYLMNADGSGLTQLTSNSVADFNPAWSPNGSRIAFNSFNSLLEYSEILVMNPDGSQTQTVTQGRTPAWLPDGTRILYAVQNEGIYMIDADGSNMRQLTDSSEHGFDWYPAVSPDGATILFGSNRNSPGIAASDSMYAMNVDGTGIGRLSSAAWGPPPYSWSPDGTLIAFTKDYASNELYLMDANGIEQWPLMDDNEGFHPVWRP